MHIPSNGFTDANIAVTNIGFVETDPYDPTQFSPADFELRTISAAVGQAAKNQPFHVSKKARLRFFFPPDYEPAEIRFSQIDRKDDANGFKNLVDRSTIGGTAEVKNILKKGFMKARWKMLIVIKNADDQIGVIDPEIVNESEDSSTMGGKP